MSLVTVINSFFRQASRKDVDGVKDQIILSERQEYIFTEYYIKKHDVNYIADNLFISPDTIHKELKTIRGKIIRVILPE